MLLFCIAGVSFLLLLEFLIYRNLKTPVFLYGIVWLLVYLSLFVKKDDFILNNSLLPSFLIATLLFSVGFRLVNFYRDEPFNHFDYNVSWNPVFKKFIFFAVYVFSFVAFVKCYSVISISEFSAWQAVRQGMSEDELFPAWIGIVFNFVRMIFFISFAIYLCTPTVKNRFEFLLILPPVLLTCLFSARGDWFMIILTLLYLMFFIRSFSNKKILTIGIVSFVLFVLIFIFSSLDKFKYAYAEMTELEKLEMLFSSYFINPVINFFYWFAESPEYADGKYTFRFFWAIKSALFGNADVVPTVLPFRTYNGVQSNVYTSLNWCARDFGIWWALAVQFFWGLFYGLLYRRFMKNDTFHLATIVILCLLVDPIVNQFFDDKFFSIMSHWVQRVIFVLVLVKTCVLIERKNQKNASNL